MSLKCIGVLVIISIYVVGMAVAIIHTWNQPVPVSAEQAAWDSFNASVQADAKELSKLLEKATKK